jgi:hypothetical protein
MKNSSLCSAKIDIFRRLRALYDDVLSKIDQHAQDKVGLAKTAVDFLTR